MGDLTYQELASEFNAAFGNNRQDLATRVTRALNIAQIRIARKNNWVELQRKVSGNTVYLGDPAQDKFMPTPENIRSIYSFRFIPINANNAPRRLLEVPQDQWDERIPEPEYFTVGYPTHYTIWDNEFEFWRIPDQSYPYIIRYTAWPTPFTGSDSLQKSELRAKDDAIIALAISWVFQGLRETDEAARWWTIYKDIITDAGSMDSEKPSLDLVPDFELGLGGSRSIGPEYYRDPFTGVGR